MKKILFAIMLLCSLVSCGTSETVVSTGVNLSEYVYSEQEPPVVMLM